MTKLGNTQQLGVHEGSSKPTDGINKKAKL